MHSTCEELFLFNLHKWINFFFDSIQFTIVLDLWHLKSCKEWVLTTEQRVLSTTSQLYQLQLQSLLETVKTSTPRTTSPESSARAGVAPTPGRRCFARYTGFRWGSVSPKKWLFWLTRCGLQPLQCISESLNGPMHHLGLCALPMLRCWSFLAYTPNWPVVLLLLHPPETLYLLTFNCAKTFSLSNATWKPICSNSLRPPVLPQAPLYLRT